MAFVFLSHSTSDKKEFVRPLYEYLVAHGVDCFLDERDIEWGKSIPKEIRVGIARVAEDPAGYLLVVISEASLASKWLQHELDEAEMLRSGKDYGYILPVVFPDVDQNAAQRVLGRSIRYIVSNDPIEIGSALVGIIGHRHPLIPRVRWSGGERELDSWDLGLLELVRMKETLEFRWWGDSNWGVLLTSKRQKFYQIFKSVISPLLDLVEAGFLQRESSQLLDDRSEEFRLSEMGIDVLEAVEKKNSWSWENRIRISEMKMIPMERMFVQQEE